MTLAKTQRQGPSAIALAVPLALAGLLLASGCRPERGAEEGVGTTVLRVGIGAEPRDLDPHLVTALPDFQVMLALFEGLVRAGPNDREPVVPGVARKWEISEDGRHYRFTLRENATWTNGDPVTAGDFVYSAQRVLDPATASPHAEWLYAVDNAEAYHQGLLHDFSEVGLVAVDRRNLEIRLHQPLPFFLELLKHPSWYPVHAPTLRRQEAETGRAAGWTRPGLMVSNGPYMLADWTPGSHIHVRRHPGYRGHDPVQLDEIHFFPIDNRNTEELAFRSGQLDITANVPFAKRDSYRMRQDPAYREYPVLATTYLLFNIRKPPLNDARVRRALALAVDRLSITENLVKTGTPATGFVPSLLPGYPSQTDTEYNVEKARQLLADAGYPGGRGFPRLEYSTSNAETARQIAEAIQNMWRTVLNIDVTLYNSEFRVYLDRLNRGEFDLGYLAWYGDFVDPYAHLILMRAGNPSNRTGWGRPRYDELLDESMQATAGERMELLARAELLLEAEMPIAPVYWVTASRLVNPRLRGWEPRLLDLHPLQYLYFETKIP